MVKVKICIGTACHLSGAQSVIASFRHLIEENKLFERVSLEGAFCMRQCENDGVAVTVNDEVFHVKAEEARRFFREKILPLAESKHK